MLHTNHEAHKMALFLQNFSGTPMRDTLLKAGYREDEIFGFVYDIQLNRLTSQCKLVDGHIQTTIRCVTSSQSEQMGLFNSIVEEFTQILQRMPVSAAAGFAREWRDTSYGNIMVMYAARYVTFSMTEIN
jgi:hypothetical protein